MENHPRKRIRTESTRTNKLYYNPTEEDDQDLDLDSNEIDTAMGYVDSDDITRTEGFRKQKRSEEHGDLEEGELTVKNNNVMTNDDA